MCELFVGVPLITFGLTSSVIGLLLLGCGLTVIRHAKVMHKQTIAKCKHVETYTKDRMNHIGTLPVKELDEYLTDLFMTKLELCAAQDVSIRDPSAAVILYGRALSEVITYLGEDNIHAIEYFYGKGYIEKWCAHRYRLMENRGSLPALFRK